MYVYQILRLLVGIMTSVHECVNIVITNNMILFVIIFYEQEQKLYKRHLHLHYLMM